MKQIVIDANLLLLLIVGSANPLNISKHKRLRAYNESHFHLLLGLIPGANPLIVTPHSLTEFWNILGERKSGLDIRFEENLASALQLLKNLIEVHRAAKDLVAFEEIAYLGLSDVAQIEAVEARDGILLSADGKLCFAAQRRGLQAIPFWQYFDNLG